MSEVNILKQLFLNGEISETELNDELKRIGYSPKIATVITDMAKRTKEKMPHVQTQPNQTGNNPKTEND